MCLDNLTLSSKLSRCGVFHTQAKALRRGGRPAVLHLFPTAVTRGSVDSENECGDRLLYVLTTPKAFRSTMPSQSA